MMMQIPRIEKTNLPTSFIIGIEGLNGVGKTTLTQNIQKHKGDFKCDLCVPELFTKNKEFKSYILFEAAATTSALYYLSGICESYRILNGFNYRQIVLDRSIWSTFAAAYAKNPEIVSGLLKAVDALKSFLVIPDVVIVLLASFETCQQRIFKKNSGKEFDKDSRELFYKKQEFYKILDISGYNIHFIDTENISANDVYGEFERVLGKIRN